MFWMINQAQAQQSNFMPPQATQLAVEFDALYKFLVISSLIASILVIFGFVWFALQYRRKSDNDKTAYITHNTTLEFLWSFIPFVIFMVMFAWGALLWHEERTMPTDAFEIHVFAQKWSWQYVYKSGKTVSGTSGEMVVPINKPIKLIMSSKDVIHSFYIPAFRLKQDVVPGRYTALWFEATELGNFQVFCAEYCGLSHSGMLSHIKVVSQEEFEQWLQTDPDAEFKGMDLVDIGKNVYQKHTCAQCHSLTDQKIVGPGFLGVFGRDREFEGGAKLVSDENYIRESILNPSAKVVKGYPVPTPMPTFAGQLTELQLSGVIAFLKTLK